MKIAMGADHAGFELKEVIKNELANAGYEITDCGTSSADVRVDYPDWGFKTAESVAIIVESSLCSSKSTSISFSSL